MALPDGQFQNITLLDIQLARIYLPILVKCAREGRTCTYTELVDEAKAGHVSNADVQKAIPVSTGRRLEVIRLYCKSEDLPDLASLVIGKNSGECGSFYLKHFDPVSARAAVFAMDWNRLLPDIDGYFEYTTTKITPRTIRKAETARQLMSDYFKENRTRLPQSIVSQREQILQMLVEGFDPEEAFAAATLQLSA